LSVANRHDVGPHEQFFHNIFSHTNLLYAHTYLYTYYIRQNNIAFDSRAHLLNIFIIVYLEGWILVGQTP
jgi:hypothetical protein